MNNPWRIKNTRDKAYELLDEGMIDPRSMAEMCLQYMSTDDIQDMLESNDVIEQDEADQD
jgi:hypothetical protein